MRLWLILVLTLQLFSSPLTAQQPVRTDAQALPPDPLDLKPGDWQYFNIQDAALLQERVQIAIERLKTLSQDESIGDDQELVSAFAQVIRRLGALPQTLSPVETAPEPPGIVKELYAFEEIQDLISRLRDKRTSLISTRYEKQQVNAGLEANQDELDTLIIQYRDLDQPSREKLVLGLNILSHRLGQALEKARLKSLNSAIEALKTEIEDSTLRLELAIPRLSLTEKSVPILEQELKTLEEASTQTARQIIALEAPSLGAIAETPGEKARLMVLRQQVILGQLKHALVEADLVLKTAELNLTRLTVQEKFPVGLTTKSVFDEGIEGIARLQDQAMQWQTITEKTLKSAQQDLSVNSDSLTEPLKRLHQDRLATAQDSLVLLQRLNSQLEDIQLFFQLGHEGLALGETSPLDWLTDIPRRIAKATGRLGRWVDWTLFHVADHPVTLWDLLSAIAVIVVTYLISKTLQRTLLRLSRRRPEIKHSVAYTLSRLSHYFLVSIGIVIALGYIGIDFTNLALIFGALGIGIGFGLQGIINNFVSGLIILFESSLEVGDYVELEGDLRGIIKEIYVRSTVITTNDGVDVLVPNSQLVSNRVINWTFRDPYRRINVPFSVNYGVDKELVEKAVMEAVDSIPFTLRNLRDREPNLRMTAFGNDGLEFELMVWVNAFACRRFGATRSAYLWAIDNAFQKYGIEVPYPQRDLHFRFSKDEIQRIKAITRS